MFGQSLTVIGLIIQAAGVFMIFIWGPPQPNFEWKSTMLSRPVRAGRPVKRAGIAQCHLWHWCSSSRNYCSSYMTHGSGNNSAAELVLGSGYEEKPAFFPPPPASVAAGRIRSRWVADRFAVLKHKVDRVRELHVRGLSRPSGSRPRRATE